MRPEPEPTLDAGGGDDERRPTLPPGSVLGRYVVEAKAGDGGHGSVYRGRHIGLDLPVAIKVLAPHFACDADVVARFLGEAQVLARIHHRHVLRIHDIGRLDDGTPYLVSEYIEGIDLERRLASGPLPVAAVVDLGRQLFAALAALAEASVLHRDVKPGNLMLRSEADGHVHVTLIDFGIARPRARGVDEAQTASGLILGTPHYMSPEQICGDPLDLRSDAYAGCAVLYEALTGRPPFDGPSAPVVLSRVLVDDVAPVRELRPDCPEDLATLVERGLSRNRALRPAHPLEVAVLLDRIAHHLALPTGALAWRDGAPEPTAPPPLAPRLELVVVGETEREPTAPFLLAARHSPVVRPGDPPAPRRRRARPWISLAALAALVASVLAGTELDAQRIVALSTRAASELAELGASGIDTLTRGAR